MAGEADAQKLWDEVAREREAGEQSPSDDTLTTTTLEEGHEETTTEESPAAETQVEEQPGGGEAAAETQQAATGGEDPFASLHPAVRERLDSLSKVAELVPQLQNSVRTAEGRVAAMQREMDVARQAAKAAPSQAAPSQAQIAAASGDVKKWESLKSDFPEWADATEQFVNAKLAGLTPQQAQTLGPDKVAEIVRDAEVKAQARALAAVEEAKVELKYENWADIVTSADFRGWFDGQPDDVKALAKSKRGRDAISLIDKFQAHADAAAAAQVTEQQQPGTSQVQQARTQKLAAAVSTRPGTGVAPSKTVDEMSPAELWEYERRRAAKRGADRGLSY